MPNDARNLTNNHYVRGYWDAHEDALAAARDRTLIVGIVFGIVGLIAGLALGGVL